jgi:lysophospholipase L1-like esterase
MKFRMRYLTILMVAGCVVAGCGPADSSGGGSGGSSASGGQTGTGSGGSGSGGMTASGGSASGGSTASGGSGSGGSSSSGGAVGSGGSASGGAAGGAVGSGGSAGGAVGGHTNGGKTGTAGAAGGGTGTGSGGAAGGASGAYNPCPATGACKVLPLGDSITEGIGSTGTAAGGAYRVDLFSRAVMAGKNLTFVGPKMAGPTTVAGMPFPKQHAGYSGYTVAQISKGTDPYKGGVQGAPNIVLIHIATNDINLGMVSGAADRESKLVDDLLTDLPNALIVVGKTIPFQNNDARVATHNNALTPLIQSKIAAGKHVLLVDLNTGFPASDGFNDFVHPNNTGYAWMAGKWFDGIKNFLGPL